MTTMNLHDMTRSAPAARPLTPMIDAATSTLVEHVDELTALDSAIGDGDHGLNMKRGALAIQAKLGELATLSLNDALRTMGMTCMATGMKISRICWESPQEPAAPSYTRHV